MARHRAKEIFEAVPRQTCPTPPLTASLKERAASEVVVVDEQGHERGGADAVFFILRKTGAFWVWPFMLPPLIWFMRAGYRVVARNRGYISRKFFGGEVCSIADRKNP